MAKCRNAPPGGATPPDADRTSIQALTVTVLPVVLLLVLTGSLPLGSALKIGADEGFELAKSVLSLTGHRFYTEVWNDQPPLHVFLLTLLVKWVSPSILGPRLLTVGFAAALLLSLVMIGRRVHGLAAGVIAALCLLSSPGFLELSCSVMQEVPALTLAVASLAVLTVAGRHRNTPATAVSGALFATALQLKVIELIYLPLALGLICLRQWSPVGTTDASSSISPGDREPPAPWPAVRLAFIFLASASAAFLGILLLTGETGSYLSQMRQLWFAHFAATKSTEYGSPDLYPFAWSVLAKHWDASVPAVVGIALIGRAWSRCPYAVLPIGWLGLMLLVFGLHRPWWSYYYVHTAVPLSLCAGIGVAEAWRRIRCSHRLLPQVALGLFLAAAPAWMGARVYLQAAGIHALPRIHSTLALREAARLRPHVRFMFTDEPIYSFHTKTPLPPALGVLSLKRFWSGDMTNARLTRELRKAKPELLLLKNETTELPFDDLIRSDYRLIYYDERTRLFGLKEMLSKVDY